jgi:hypothetical protein
MNKEPYLKTLVLNGCTEGELDLLFHMLNKSLDSFKKVNFDKIHLMSEETRLKEMLQNEEMNKEEKTLMVAFLAGLHTGLEICSKLPEKDVKQCKNCSLIRD